MAIAIALAAHLGGPLRPLEQESFDKRMQMRGAERPAGLTVVAVDDKTFAGLQRRWPFPRSLYGRVIDRLSAAGAKEIVVDVQFTEPTSAREDGALYDAIDRAGGAVLATSETNGRGGTNVLGGDENLAAIGARAAAANLPEDDRGVLRRFRSEEGGLESIAVAVARRQGRSVEGADFGSGGAWIDYRGPAGTVPTLSFVDALRGKFPASAVRGKVVVIGATAPTLQDVHPTPASTDGLMPGPEIQANAIWTAMNGLPLRSAPAPFGFIAIVVLGLAVPLAACRVRLSFAALGGIGLGLAYALAAKLLFDAGTVILVAAPLASLALASVLTVSTSYAAEYRERRRMALMNALLEEKVRERTRELHDTQLEVIQRLGQAVEWRDEETGDHVERMSALCYRLGLAAGLDDAEASTLKRAAALHDVGKIGVPDAVLRKAGPLDAEEWELIRQHTLIGAGILSGSRSPIVQMAEEIARTHHEHWDGTGYPEGLRGEEIPLAGRICAISDVFDALTSSRPYKASWSVDRALVEIKSLAGQHFDPDLVDRFMTLAPDLRREYGESYNPLPSPAPSPA
jgi:response regulator RpfG family c-di-GMP phosphodiesterase